jgi:hypothetical protein
MRRLAFAAISVSVVAAIYVHNRTHEERCEGFLGAPKPMCAVRSSWQDPTAVLLVLAGLVAAAALIALSRRDRVH